ncbi:hypothetical protein LS77_008655 [Helicobacter bilis]|uniref:Uncharacterized protein n=2 Tax=Helicobacter bilis TaxID=37372 RepID=A0A6D2CAI8_9HELI|nr:hypothetical protein [Helicobacter bilis]EMZ37266.1 hypothetical protein C826_02128 [Helicobacter bilis WiWa]TLE03566.1 hypothetical protein LS77_008655 [Helicobacter bilis]TLE04308.1 hypothetical protein LS76_008735 [Helicobacter bilis]
MNKIQVSTIAKPRDEYTSQFKPNTEIKTEWIPKKPSVFKTLKFENESVNPSDYYAPVCKSYTEKGIFQAGDNGCVVFVLCVGGHGYGTDTKGFGGAFPVAFTNPVGGWQIRTNASHGVGNGVNHKFEAHNKSSTQNNYIHNPPVSVASPSTFGSYLSSNAGLSIEANTITNKQIYRQWLCTGWDGWWAIGDRYKRSYWANETQNVKLSSGAYDGDLLGTSGEIKFGVFKLNPNEVVNISVGEGFVKGHVDIVYFELRNGNDEAITKPSQPNDVTAGIPLPAPTPPQVTPTPPPPLPLTLGIKPDKLELEVGATQTIEIITNATSYTSNMQDDTIASFNEATKEITAKIQGDTMLTIEGIRDNESIRRAVAIKVIEKQVIINPTPPTTTPPQNTPKSINFTSLLPNLQTMNTEQLAYMYVIGFVWQELFKIAQNDNNMTLLHTTITEKRKKELQDLYDTQRINYAQKQTLIGYAPVGYQILSTHISAYPFLQSKDEAHLQTLESLIIEKESVEQGMTFTHVFSEAVENMSNADFTDNLEVWIKEAQGVITRTRLEDPKPNQTPQGLDSLNVVFSKNPNSYIARNETDDELKIDRFNCVWEDPLETDYIHELFWFIVYDEAKVGFDMQKVKETWITQKNHAGDKNVSNTPEKRQNFINVGNNIQVGAIGQIFRKAYFTDMKDELFEAYDVAPYKMRLKKSIYQLSKEDLLELFTRACQKVYAISKT